MTAGRPVARVLSPVIVSILVLTIAMAAVATIGLYLTTRSVQYLTEELQPAASANQDILADLGDVRSAAREWVVAGGPSARTDYREARRELRSDLRAVRKLSEKDDELRRLLDRQEAAAMRWIDEYAAPVLAGPGGVGTFDRALFATGVRLFDSFRAAHEATTSAFGDRVDEANADATWRLRATVLAVLVLAVIEGFVIVRSRRRLAQEIAEPLHELEGVVHEMVRERDVRAPLVGPREVRAVAGALNELAEAQSRAQEVESRIRKDQRALDVAQDDFVSNVSHELRTPLTTIHGYLELVSEEFEGSMSPRHARMLSAGQRNVARLQHLVDDLLTLSKAEASATSVERLDLATVLRPVVTDVHVGATRRGIGIEVSIPKREVLVLGDRVMLHRAFLNVLTNAVKFSDEGGTVEVDTRGRGRQRGSRGARPRNRHSPGRDRPTRDPVLPGLQRGEPGHRRFRSRDPDRADDHGEARRVDADRVDRGGGHEGDPPTSAPGRPRRGA